MRRGDAVTVGAAGTHGPDRPDPVHPDTVFRISSLTKPVVAALAMVLVDDGVLDLDARSTTSCPSSADRRVLVDPADAGGPTVRAHRPVTVRDVLELRAGMGMDLAPAGGRPTTSGVRASSASGPCAR